MRYLLVAYAVVNAILYSVLLPLWEGFDEPFHYGYVQHLATGRGVPDARTSRLSEEIEASLRLAPASHIVKRNLGDVRTYAEFFSLPAAERDSIRRELLAISPDLRLRDSTRHNYQGQHAPLAYTLLAPFDAALASWQVVARVRMLRAVAGIAGMLLLLFGAGALARLTRLPEPFDNAALFCLISSQMIWATVVHVTNDWLALPLSVWLLAALLQAVGEPTPRRAALAGLTLAAGLLAKGYFLAFAPLVPLVLWWRTGVRNAVIAAGVAGFLAGPWYVRNWVLYGTVSGMQEARQGIGLTDLASAAAATDWPSMLLSSARAALWTANNSFTSFSAGTIYLTLALCVAAFLLWVRTRHTVAERIVAAFVAIFLVALAYSALVARAFTGYASAGASPWYSQVVVPPLLVLCMFGAARWRSGGSVVAAAIVSLFGYIALATYPLKLIPLYAGYQGRINVQSLITLYSSGSRAQLSERLSAVALAPTEWVLVLAALVAALITIQWVFLLRALRCKPYSCRE